MVDFINKLHESGIEIATLLDGTYRLNSLGWVVSILAMHSCLFTPEKGYYQVCLPLIHLITFTEVELAYRYHLESVTNLPITHFGSSSKLKINHMRQDGALCILNASNEVFSLAWKGICGVHVIRKSSKVSKLQNRKLVSECIKAMRNAKSLEMFKIITSILINHIIHNLKEKKIAESFAKFYLHEKRLNWYYSSSKMPGVSSDSNALENYNNTGELLQRIIFNSPSKKLLLFAQASKKY